MVEWVSQASAWVVPAMILFIPLYGALRGVNVYEAFVDGAKESFDMAIRVLPFMVAIFIAIGLFRASGALDIVIQWMGPFLRWIGLPGSVVPLVLIRPLSGTASLGILADLLKNVGPDTFAGRLASAIQGSTDTTFYVLTVYFGAVGIRRTRYAVPVGLLGDAAGFMAAILICHQFFPS